MYTWFNLASARDMKKVINTGTTMYFLNQHFLLEFNPISARLYSHCIPYYIQSSFSQSAQRCCWLNPMKPQRCCHSIPSKILKIHNPSKIHENQSRINPKPSKIGQIHPALSPFTGHWSPKTVPLPRGRGAWRRQRAAAERPRPARRPRRGGRATAPRNSMGNQVMMVSIADGLWWFMMIYKGLWGTNCGSTFQLRFWFFL